MKSFFGQFLLAYFRVLAQVQLLKIRPTIIGITGSMGKTSTMEACNTVLSPFYTVKVSRKANSESGIPLNILGLTPHDYSFGDWLGLAFQAPLQLLFNWERQQIYLVEMGIDSPHPPKNMSYLLKILQPKVGIFINVGPVHSANFDELAKSKDPEKRRAEIKSLIAAEKGKLITSLPQKGTAIINTDDEDIARLAGQTEARVFSFGKSALTAQTSAALQKSFTDLTSPTVQIGKISWTQTGTTFELTVQGQPFTLNFEKYVLPEHYAATFAAAICCGISQDISPEQAIEALTTSFELPPGRASVIPGINGSTILDSSYNASTGPMLDMLELLKKVPGARKLALLGDMRELGSVTEQEHTLVAKKAADVCDKVFLVGPAMQEFALPVLEKKGVTVEWFENAYQAADRLKKIVKKDDVLLVKGSQNTLLLEIAVEELMAEPEKAKFILSRRGEYWDGEREKLKTSSEQTE